MGMGPTELAEMAQRAADQTAETLLKMIQDLQAVRAKTQALLERLTELAPKPTKAGPN